MIKVAIRGLLILCVAIAHQASARVGGVATIGAPVTQTASLWAGTDTPSNANNTDGQALEVGTQFTTGIAGDVTALRFYKGASNTGAHVGSLWTAAGTLLAQVTFSGETASGWQQQALPTPITLSVGPTYVVSVHSTGFYASQSGYFDTAHTSGPLTGLATASATPGNGLYSYTAVPAFPTSTSGSAGYFADIVFRYTPPPQAPVAISFSPASPITVADSIANATVITAVSVSTNDFAPFPSANLTLTANAGGRVSLAGNNIVAAHGFTAADDGTSLTITVQASENGTTITNSFILNVVSQTVTSIALSGVLVPSGSPSGTTVGTISITLSPTTPAFTGGTVALGTGSGCPGTNNSNFSVVGGTTLQTSGAVSDGTKAICLVATKAGLGNSPFAQAFNITVGGSAIEVPGPSAVLFNSPYYQCNQNWYISTTGSDSNDGLAATTGGGHGPWATVNHAVNSVTIGGTGSWCVNAVPGSYTQTNSFASFGKGGTTASSTGYLVFRCQTLNGCTLNGNSNTMLSISSTGNAPGHHIIIDGFTMVGEVPQTSGFGTAVTAWDGGGGTCAGTVDCVFATHHVWVLNSIISGFSQSGLQLNDGDYYYAIHNTIHHNAQSSTCSVYGSGISYAGLKAAPSYTPTADDLSNPAMGVFAPYHNVVSWNLIYNNVEVCGTPSSTGGTDSNGITFDTNSNWYNSYGWYAPRSLLAFNIIYNNGGAGIWNNASAHIETANNSCYNNTLVISGTARPCMGTQGAYDNFYFNNAGYAIVGSSFPLNSNNVFQLDCAGGTPCDSGTNNISYCTATPATAACEAPYNGSTFSCSANKCTGPANNPMWVNVGNTTRGTTTSPPVGVNFALPSGSPGIGYGLTQSYLPAQSIDVGACNHLLLTCP